MNSLQELPIDAVRRRADVRSLHDGAVEALAESIGTIGLINPIRVRQIGDEFEVVAGSHRLAACDSLGWSAIPALVVDDDDLHAELAMIDENLCRAELSPVDRAKQTARRKAIYEALHPETKHGENQHTRSPQLEDSSPAPRFTAATATATGRSEQAVQRDAERGTKVSDDAAEVIRGTRLDTGSYLDRIKKVPAEQQTEQVRRDLAEPQRLGGIAGRYTPSSTKELSAEERIARFIKWADDGEALDAAALVKAAGRKRALVKQRASSLVLKINQILEADG